MRLLDTHRAADSVRESRKQANPVLRAAVISGCVVLLCSALLLSPLFRVTTVVWTGSIVLSPEDCERIEAASLGQSLLLLPVTLLRARAHDATRLDIHFKKHFPSTLEVYVVSRLAVARTDLGVVTDRRGRALDAVHADAGLPTLSGFAMRRGNLDAAGVRVTQALEQLRAYPALYPSRVERRGDDVVLTLSRTGTRLYLRIAALDGQLHKMRLYEQSLGAEELPAVVDLRFRDQIVVRTGPGGAHADG